jgi:hypothetical protein
MGFISSTTFSLEHLYAQENTTGDGELIVGNGLSGGVSSGGDISGGGLSRGDSNNAGQRGGGVDCPSDFYESNGECFPYESGQQLECPPDYVLQGEECIFAGDVQQLECPPDYVLQGEECIFAGVSIGNGSQPQSKENIPQPQPDGVGVDEIIDRGKGLIDPVKEKFADPEGFVGDTLSTINEKSPVSAPLIAGIVAVVAIGAGIASFSRHHHGRSSSSHTAQHQTQEDDSKEEQIYEDVQVVTQGGIEEV